MACYGFFFFDSIVVLVSNFTSQNILIGTMGLKGFVCANTLQHQATSVVWHFTFFYLCKQIQAKKKWESGK